MVDDHRIAAEVAEAAGRILLEVRAAMAGAPERELRDAGDKRSHDFIVEALAARCPADAVLSEEGADVASRLDAARVWIVDPLDGTREFAEGRSDWAVHVALVVDEVPVAGAVALPAMGRTLVTDPAPVLAPAVAPPVRLVVSRTRPPAITGRLEDALGAVRVPLGSAGAKAMAIVLGDADVYAHAGGQYEWDSAAPVAVAAAAGLHTSRLDGSPLRYNQPDPYLPDLLVCRRELASQILEVVNRPPPA